MAALRVDTTKHDSCSLDVQERVFTWLHGTMSSPDSPGSPTEMDSSVWFSVTSSSKLDLAILDDGTIDLEYSFSTDSSDRILKIRDSLYQLDTSPNGSYRLINVDPSETTHQLNSPPPGITTAVHTPAGSKRCCVTTCRYSSSNDRLRLKKELRSTKLASKDKILRMFQFPSFRHFPERFLQWMQLCGRLDLLNYLINNQLENVTLFVCGKHFSPEVRDSVLLPTTAVPTLEVPEIPPYQPVLITAKRLEDLTPSQRLWESLIEKKIQVKLPEMWTQDVNWEEQVISYFRPDEKSPAYVFLHRDMFPTIRINNSTFEIEPNNAFSAQISTVLNLEQLLCAVQTFVVSPMVAMNDATNEEVESESGSIQDGSSSDLEVCPEGVLWEKLEKGEVVVKLPRRWKQSVNPREGRITFYRVNVFSSQLGLSTVDRMVLLNSDLSPKITVNHKLFEIEPNDSFSPRVTSVKNLEELLASVDAY